MHLLSLVLHLGACAWIDDTTWVERLDVDGDGVSWPDDCDDDDEAIRPGGIELCNGVDDDCDGEVDNNPQDAIAFYPDVDLDGYGDENSTFYACELPDGYLESATDCDDGNAGINPLAVEICDGVNNDCDEDTEDGCASVLDASAVMTLDIAGAESGAALTAGDVDGDGIVELFIAAPAANTTVTGGGLVSTVRGDPDPIVDLEDSDLIFEGDDAQAAAGAAILALPAAKALMIGAPAKEKGIVHVFRWGDGSDPDGTVLTSAADVTMAGGAIGDGAGASLAALDDGSFGTAPALVGGPFADGGYGKVWIADAATTWSINLDDGATCAMPKSDTSPRSFGDALVGVDLLGEGRDLVVVAAPKAAVDGSPGAVYVLDPQVAFGDPTTDALAVVTGTFGGTTETGISLAGADADGDGTPDVVVGDGFAGPDPERPAGEVYVYAGGRLGSGSYTLDDADATLQFAQNTGRAGWAVAGGGDVGGTGAEDLVVGVPGDDAADGAVWVLFGPFSGVVDSVSAGVRYDGQADDNAGAAVLIVPDLDHGGREDILVGAPMWGSGASGGHAYLLYGEAQP